MILYYLGCWYFDTFAVFGVVFVAHIQQIYSDLFSISIYITEMHNILRDFLKVYQNIERNSQV